MMLGSSAIEERSSPTRSAVSQNVANGDVALGVAGIVTCLRAV